MKWDFEELLYRLQTRDEYQRIEAKEAKNSLGKSALETISAFSNEPDLGGGYLVLGLRKRENGSLGEFYEIQGVSQPDLLQQEITNACRNHFNRRIIPEISIHSIEDKLLIVAFIPESFCRDKPVYIKSKGEKEGAYRRIGSSDVRCSEEDLDILYQLRHQRYFESEILPGVSWNDISLEAITEYRRIRSKVDPNASELKLDDQGLLVALKMAVKNEEAVIPTVGGILFFGSRASLRREFPMASRVDYIVVNGTKWVEDPSARWELALEYMESLVTLLPRLHAQIMRDIPKKFGLETGQLQRTDILQIPIDVIREALLNALIHRDYRSHQPTQIIRYSNRLEFRNAGYSLKSLEDFEEPGSKPRNPNMAAVFYDLDEIETKGTGIRTMKAEMKKAGLSTPPIFESNREANEFDLILLPHHLLDRRTLEWLQQFKKDTLTDAKLRALAFVKEIGAITNQDYRQLNGVDTLVASMALRELRDAELFVQKGKGHQTYYQLNPYLEESYKSEGITPQVSGQSEGLSPQISLPGKGIDALLEKFPDLPDSLREEIEALSMKRSRENLKELIKKLCSLGPLQPSELGRILNRNPQYLKSDFLYKMIKKGELVYFYPEQPAHPGQAYKIPDSGEEIE